MSLSVPLLSFEAEASGAAVKSVPARLSAFAGEHGVGDAVRTRLAAVAAEAVATLAVGPTVPRPGPIRVEADIAEQQLQVVIARDVDSSEAAATMRFRLAAITARADAFSAEHAGATGIEFWMCFRVEGVARTSAA